MKNACKDIRSWQTFPWQAVSLYEGIGKNVCRKSFQVCDGYEKEQNKSVQNVLQRKIFSVSDCPDYLFASFG